MNCFKKLSASLFHPSAVRSLVLVPLSAAVLLYLFGNGLDKSNYAYPCYLLSAYTLMITVPLLLHAGKGIKAAVYRHEYGKRCLMDLSYRAKLTLSISLGINLLYSAAKLFAGILYSSFWCCSVAVYYMVLCICRFLLLHQFRKESPPLEDLKKYRLCGILLLLLNIALSSMVAQMVVESRSNPYPGSLIYGAAAYTFYCFTAAIVSLIKFRGLHSPLLAASKRISFVTALVALISLQTAMIAAFGEPDGGAARFNALTGLGICLILLITAASMIVCSTQKLKQIKDCGTPSRL